MAIELGEELQDWNVETLREMVAKMAAEREVYDDGKGELIQVKVVYCHFGEIAAAGIKSNYNNFTFSFYFSFSGEPTYTADENMTHCQKIRMGEVPYPIDPEEVDESMFIDFMIFLGESAEMIEG